MEARGEIESARPEPTGDEDALRAEVNDEASDITASETHSLTADKGSDRASPSKTEAEEGLPFVFEQQAEENHLSDGVTRDERPPGAARKRGRPKGTTKKAI